MLLHSKQFLKIYCFLLYILSSEEANKKRVEFLLKNRNRHQLILQGSKVSVSSEMRARKQHFESEKSQVLWLQKIFCLEQICILMKKCLGMWEVLANILVYELPVSCMWSSKYRREEKQRERKRDVNAQSETKQGKTDCGFKCVASGEASARQRRKALRILQSDRCSRLKSREETPTSSAFSESCCQTGEQRWTKLRPSRIRSTVSPPKIQR